MTTQQGHFIAERYRLLESLGRGGMGVVWHARDEMLGRDVAIKEVLLPLGLTAEEQQILFQRTLREARATARLNHPNVVTVWDVVEEDGRPWIVMELVRSRSLMQVLQEDGALPPREVAELGLQVLAALTAAHSVGILHRDVKPSNVLLGEDGRVVLTDFGIATLEGDAALTGSGTIVGSPAYIAPERARGHAAGPESDLWALGATLYTAVEGRPPYVREGPVATLIAVATQDPDPPELAGPLTPVLDGLLRRDPSQRISADEARKLLSDVPRHTPAPPPARTPEPPHPTEPRSQPTSPARRYVPLAVVIALLLVTAVAFLVRDVGRPADDDQTARGATATPSAGPTGTPSQPPSSSAAPPTRTPPTSAPPTATAPAVPAGFTRYRDRTGFSVAIPNGWRVSRREHYVYVREPDGSRFLLIDQTTRPKSDPVADWTQQEAARRDDIRDYRRIRIYAVDYYRAAADWEFTHTADDGTPLHVVSRGFVTSPTQAYGLYWSTPESQWQSSRRYFDVFADTFTPRP